MCNTKHTPGPWTYSAGPYRIEITSETSLKPTYVESEPLHTVADLGPVEAWQNLEIKANARLIAAAPELLAAIDSIGGVAYDAPVYGEEEMRERLLTIRDIAFKALKNAKGE